ncbi:MAG: DUF4932 domain-containing protein [Firmicutes bacterium]|nr:DUF4932 domain-containing protein [Bacillota bacterium]
MHFGARVLSLGLLIVGLGLGWRETPAAAGEEWAPVRMEGTPPGVYVEILPEVELLSGVLAQSSWMKTAGPQGTGNRYFRELKAFLAPFEGHEAVKAAQRLTNMGFTYDAPPNFIVSLGPLPELAAPPGGYSGYLRQRARGEAHLERFRRALVDLAERSNFARFFGAHREDYAAWLGRAVIGFRPGLVMDWLHEFFGYRVGEEFHLVFAPAMFPAGGYGATVKRGHRTGIYEFVRAAAEGEGDPVFPSGSTLEYLTLHEWGHAFVNPALEKHRDRVRRLAGLYRPVAGLMRQQAYSMDDFFNEQVLRAVTTLAAGELYGPETRARSLAYEVDRGFYLTAFTLGELEYYEAHRDRFPCFVDCVPYLLDRYAAEERELRTKAGHGSGSCRPAKRGGPGQPGAEAERTLRTRARSLGLSTSMPISA